MNRAGLLGAAVGVAAAGIAGGIAAQRFVSRRGRAPALPDPGGAEPFGELPFDRELTVVTDDGVELHVEVVEPPGGGPPDLTVVFVHGLALDMGTFHFQRRDLTGRASPRLRCVYYDQPGHGASGRPADGRYSIDALGAALHTVIGAVAPDGPLALVTHSMGGMAVMALAESDPELFAGNGRVRAVAFISSSAGKLADVPLGLPRPLTRVRQRLIPLLTGVAKLTPAMIDRARGVATDVSYLLTRRFGFAGDDPNPALVAYVERMNGRTSVEVLAGYLATLFSHDRSAALAALAQVDVLVVTGDSDVFTPQSHGAEIHRLLPGSQLVVVPDAGHMALMEYPRIVNPELRKLLDRAAGARSD